MGVAGSGKTTIGRLLAARRGWPFYDGDDYHPPDNVAKMSAGIPLDDVDRAGWLASLASLIRQRLARGESGVVACSALKRAYRDVLMHAQSVDDGRVRFVYLRGDYDTIKMRLHVREGHFMGASLLQSQFDALEEPDEALIVDATLAPDEIISRIENYLMEKRFALGIMGLGVMGRSLAYNFERNGFPVVGYDPRPALPDDFPSAVVDSPAALVAALDAPRVVLLMIPAGPPVDGAIAALKDYLQAGDIIIDGGNSYFIDTERRLTELTALGIHFVGMGVSGGEEGALRGPSLMPGGAREAWPIIAPMLTAIAAKAHDGEPMVTWIGPGGAGHYVKMVHNGIEYGDMQLIAETYDLLHRGAGLSNEALAGLFARWNKGDLHSFLIGITAEVLRYYDKETGRPLVDLIMDIAGQKGTGRWTSQIALEVGAPTPTIIASVVARLLSAAKAQRVAVAERLGGTDTYDGDVAVLTAAAEEALYAAKIAVYAQGMSLLREASNEYGWALDNAAIVRNWRAGCIIMADLLEPIAAAYQRRPDLLHLFLDESLAGALVDRQTAWRQVVITAARLGVPLLAIAASLGYFDAFRSERLPANLIQAQRDYFGAHTYHRIDRDGVFHTEWDE